MKFNAALQGVDLGKASKKKKEQNMMFPHPDAFEDLSEEEKQKETEKRMAMHRMTVSKQLRL
jgi:hypothetical protein